MSDLASENEDVQSIRTKLLNNLNTNKIFVEWADQNGKMVKMVIESDEVVKREKFDNIIEDDLPHGVFSYETYPSNGARSWAETRVIFHV